MSLNDVLVRQMRHKPSLVNSIFKFKTHSKLCDFMISKGRIMKPLFTLGEVRFLLPIFFLILISLYLDFNYFKRYHSSGGSL